jgi:hypothetical protein
VTVYTIVLERITTGEVSPSMLTRQPDEAAARAYAEAAIKDHPDLRIAEIRARN